MCNLISVIIPIYNVEKYLFKCIDSVLSQTYNNIEIILVDDGSTDSCGQICDAYRQQDHRVTVIHKSNGGLSDARNAGIEIAKGDYISFIDSDDYIQPTTLELLLTRIVESEADIAICNFKYVDESGSDLESMNLSGNVIKDRVYTSMEIFYDEMSKSRYCDWVVAWNKLYRREIFQEVRYPVGLCNEDEYVANEIYTRSYKVAGIADCCYYYVQRMGSIMNTASQVKLADGADALLDRCIYWTKYSTDNAYTLLSYTMDRIANLYPEKNSVVEYKKRYKRYKFKIKNIVRQIWKNQVSLKRRMKLIAAYISPYYFWLLKKYTKIQKES